MFFFPTQQHPVARVVVLLTLVKGVYKKQTFTEDASLMSVVLPELELTVAQILTAGM